jgi:probable rRNA maturation factor
VSVFFSDEQDEPVDGGALLDFARQVLVAEGLPASTEMAVLLVGPDQIADYNGRFMGRIEPTDVLAFPVEDLEPGSIPRLAPDDPPLQLGDVFLCPAEASRRAVDNGFDPEDFLYLLAAHGILHLLGYDHDDESEAARMERREDELLGLIGRRL